MPCSRMIRVAVVRADQEIVLAGEPQDIWNVVVRLAGHPDTILLEKILRRGAAEASGEAAAEIVVHVRNPLRGGFDETDPQVGELLRNPCQDPGVTRGH